jgi:flagellar hook-associated protein 1 FlgK
MSLTGMSALISSARTQQLAAQIIANNIANAATPGYSRQIPILASTRPIDFALMGTSARAQLGTGVQLYTVARARDEFLDTQIRQQLATLGQQNAMNSAVDLMKTLFPELNATPGEGFITYIDRMFADFTALSAAPASGAARDTLVSDAQTMCGLLNGASENISQTQGILNARVTANVAKIQGLLIQVAAANQAIISASAGGGVPNDTMDKRDLALNELAKIIKIDTAKMTDGSVLVMTGNNRVLVQGDKVATVAASTDSHTGLAGLGIVESAGLTVITHIKDVFIATKNFKVTDITGELDGGELIGNVTARDEVLGDEKLELDELASSMIEQVNLLHQAGYAQDGVTTNQVFFTGTKAGDIAVNTALVASSSLVAASRIYGNGLNGNQAESMGLLANMMMNSMVQSGTNISNVIGTIDPTLPMASLTHTALNGANPFSRNFGDFQTAPSAAGTLVINGVSINWANTDSINDIVGKINATTAGTGARASFDWTRQRLSILSSTPLTVYDAAGNLTAALNLQFRATSLTAMNNGIGPTDNAIVPGAVISASDGEYRTLSSDNGTITINGTNVAWTESQTLTGVRAAINAALAAQQLSMSFSVGTQKMTLVGTRPVGTAASAANPIKPVSITDTSGNLGMVLNMEAQPTFEVFRSAMLAQMQAQEDGSQALADQAQGMVEQLQAQQDAIMKVNVDLEKEMLIQYARAYEASIRAMGVLDEMLNVLINKMAVTTSSGTSSALNP